MAREYASMRPSSPCAIDRYAMRSESALREERWVSLASEASTIWSTPTESGLIHSFQPL